MKRRRRVLGGANDEPPRVHANVDAQSRRNRRLIAARVLARAAREREGRARRAKAVILARVRHAEQDDGAAIIESIDDTVEPRGDVGHERASALHLAGGVTRSVPLEQRRIPRDPNGEHRRLPPLAIEAEGGL